MSKVRIGKDAVSRIASRLEEQQKVRRERSPEEQAYPYLYLYATYLKVRWGARVTTMALLVCVGVDEEGFLGKSRRLRWPARRRERPTLRCFGASSTGAYTECIWWSHSGFQWT